MSRDVTEAHFLHQRSGLEAVLRPPVPSPTALCWLPGREELYACSRDGIMYAVDPVLGTRAVVSGLGEVAALSIHPDRKRFVAANRTGEWISGRVTGEIDAKGKHPLLGGFDVFWLGDYAVLAGDDGAGRAVLVIGNGSEMGRLTIPARSTPVPGEQGKLLLARSTPAGLELLAVARSGRYPEADLTAHRLRSSGPFVLGFTQTGIAVWDRSGGQPRSMRLPELTGGDVAPGGRYLGLGTRGGAVALALLHKLDARTRPHLVKAFDSPVCAVAFSERGRWLATAAESLRIWTWEDVDDD